MLSRLNLASRKLVFAAALFSPALCAAGTLIYDPAGGLLPQQTNAAWTYTQNNGTAPTVTVSGGVLTETSALAPRGVWDGNLLVNNSPGVNLFIQTTAKVLSESHTDSNRGISIFEAERTTAGLTGTTNEVDGYAWTDRIFWTNSVGTKVGEYLLDTTLEHTYRLEVDGDNDYIYVDGTLVGTVLNNTYQNGSASQPDVLRTRFGDSSAASASSVQWLNVTAGALQENTTQENPVLPELPPPGTGGTTDEGVYVFNNVPSGRWFDPPFADGFTYSMTSSSLFTEILGFPTGYSQPFTITAEGHSWIAGPGDTLDFTALLGHGVSTFSLKGISPLVDAADSSAFPLQLAFSTPTADFTMTPDIVPEPASVVVWSLVGCLFGAGGLRKRLRQTTDA